MPRDARSANLTLAYRNQLLVTRQTANRALAATWQTVDSADIVASYKRAAPGLASIVEGAQRRNVTVSQRYARAYLANETRKRTASIAKIEPDKYIGNTPQGGDTPTALKRSMYGALTAAQYGRGEQVASAIGFNILARSAGAQILGAGRQALGDIIRGTDAFEAWIRVVSDTACGACLGLTDGAEMDPNDDPEVHENCRCVAEPQVAGVPNNAPQPTGADVFNAMSEQQQNQLFDGKGGADKAALVRAGDASLADLVHRHEPTYGPPTISEAPLSAITP